MSEQGVAGAIDKVTKRLCLIGATGLIGKAVIAGAIDRPDLRIIGVARREMPLPTGAKMEMVIADPSGWPAAIGACKANVLVCALGTTMKQAGGDKAAFRAVDFDLVIDSARAAVAAGIDHMIVVSSVGADAGSNSFYLRTKGEMEDAVRKLGFRRVDVLRPGLLVGKRQTPRPMERVGMWLSPLLNLILHGTYRKYRSIRASQIADAVFALSHEKTAGKFVHDHDSLLRAARRTGR